MEIRSKFVKLWKNIVDEEKSQIRIMEFTSQKKQ